MNWVVLMTVCASKDDTGAINKVQSVLDFDSAKPNSLRHSMLPKRQDEVIEIWRLCSPFLRILEWKPVMSNGRNGSALLKNTLFGCVEKLQMKFSITINL